MADNGSSVVSADDDGRDLQKRMDKNLIIELEGFVVYK